MIIPTTIALTLSVTVPCSAQVVERWTKRYNGPAKLDDGAVTIRSDRTGNLFVTGHSAGAGRNEDYYTAKYAAVDGALLWERRYNGPANSRDFARALAIDQNGNAIVTGASTGGTTWEDYYTAKYASADGALVWERRYNGPGNFPDRATGVAVDGTGNVYVTGHSADSKALYDYYTASYAAKDGKIVWEKRYNGPADESDVPQALLVDANINIIVCGESPNRSGLSNNYTVKYSRETGAQLWERSPDVLVDSFSSVVDSALDSEAQSSHRAEECLS